MFAIDGATRPRLPEPGLRQAAGQLHLVGQPGGRRRLQPVRGRLPRPRQHRPHRPLAPAGRAARSSSPTPPGGWPSTRWPWPASPSILQPHEAPPDDRPRAQVPRALRRSSAPPWTTRACGTRRTASSTTAGHCPTAPRCRSRCARWSGVIPLLAAVVLDEDVIDAGRRRSASASPRCSRPPAGRPRRRSTSRAACAAQPGERRFLLGVVGVDHLRRLLAQAVRRGRVPVAPRAARPVRVPPRPPLPHRRRGRHAPRIDYEPAESTTAMFGGNSNWRGPVWFPLNYLADRAPSSATTAFFGDEFTDRVPDRLGPAAAPSTRSPTTSASGSISLFLVGADGRRPVLRRRRAAPDRPGLEGQPRVQRVLPRRQRRRAGRVAPDGLDGPRRRPHPGPPRRRRVHPSARCSTPCPSSTGSRP